MSKRANGEGTIYKSEAKKCWVGQISFVDDYTGKTSRKTVYGKTQKAVKEKLDKIRNERIINAEEVTVSQLAEKQIERDHQINVLKDSSYKRKLETLKKLQNHPVGYIPLKKLNNEVISDFFTSITHYSNSVISKVYELLKATLKQAVMLGYIPLNPLDNTALLKKPVSDKKTKKIGAFTVDEQRRFLQVLRDDSKILYKEQFLIEMFTGARMGEINALTPQDIDLQNNTIRINKTISRDERDKPIVGTSAKTVAGTRVLHISDDLKELLRKYLDDNRKPDQLIFLSKRGTLVTTDQVNMEFKRVCKKYNINKGYNVNQHMLRHTFATRCIESGMPAHVLQKILGHTDISTTISTYTDVFAEYERKNVDRTDEYLRSMNLKF